MVTGDTIYGDVFGGDNLHGNKIVTHGSRRRARSVEPAVILVSPAPAGGSTSAPPTPCDWTTCPTCCRTTVP